MNARQNRVYRTYNNLLISKFLCANYYSDFWVTCGTRVHILINWQQNMTFKFSDYTYNSTFAQHCHTCLPSYLKFCYSKWALFFSFHSLTCTNVRNICVWLWQPHHSTNNDVFVFAIYATQFQMMHKTTQTYSTPHKFIKMYNILRFYCVSAFQEWYAILIKNNSILIKISLNWRKIHDSIAFFFLAKTTSRCITVYGLVTDFCRMVRCSQISSKFVQKKKWYQNMLFIDHR